MPDKKVSVMTLVPIVEPDDDMYIIHGGVSMRCNPSQVKSSFMQNFNEVLTSGVNTLLFSQSLGTSASSYDFLENLFDADGNAYFDYTIEKIDEDSISVTVSDSGIIIKLIAFLL
jgi:hypothetical protein